MIARTNMQVWEFRHNERIYDKPLRLNPQIPPVLFHDGRRIFANFAIWDLKTGNELARVDFGSHFAAVVNNSLLIADHDGNLRYWRRRREEGSWTPLNFPEPWIAGVFAILFILDVIRHSRRQAVPDNSRHALSTQAELTLTT